MLELEALGCGLDHEVAAGEILEGRRRLQPPGGRGVVFLLQAPARRGQPALERVAVGVVDERPRAGLRRELRDAGAHRAGAEDADRLHQTIALIPVAARPMISFWICDVPS